MNRTILLGTLTAALLAPFAMAHAHSSVGVSVSTPEFGIRIGSPMYHPAPMYAPGPFYAPAPVVIPAPVYAAPPVFIAPRVVYPAPVIVAPRHFAPRHYGPPAGVWVAPRPYRHRHWDDRHDGRREDRRDRDGRRAGYGF